MSSLLLLQFFTFALAFQLLSALDLSVMSYNLYGWNAFGQNSWKARNILKKMKQYAPDIMGCQEVEGNANWIVADTADAGKGAFAVAGQHAGHAIFYRSKLFNVEDQGVFDIKERDQWGLRQLSWVKFLHKSSGQSFLHFNSHWCVCGESQLFQTAQDVAHWVVEVRARFNNLPAMLTGDFNVFGGCQNSKAIRYLIGQTVDGQQSPGVFFDANNGQGATFGGCKIDYILLTGEWIVQESLVDRDHRNGAIGSDHDSLYAKLGVGSGPSPPPANGGSCEEGGSVWNRMANGHTCGDRIQWVSTNQLQGDLPAAKEQVASEYPSICGACASQVMTTSTTKTMSSQLDSCEEGGSVWNTIANGHTCGNRIEWLSANELERDVAAAKAQVASEYPIICGACASDEAPRCEGLQYVEQRCSSNGCKVLAGGMTDRTCDDYCGSHGLSCKGAWEEVNEDCNVRETMTCTQVWPGTSDLLCECEPARRLSAPEEEMEEVGNYWGSIGFMVGGALLIFASVMVAAGLRWRQISVGKADETSVQNSQV